MRSHRICVCILVASTACPLANSEAAAPAKPKAKRLRPDHSALIYYKAGNDQGVVNIGMKRIEPRPDVKTRPGQPLAPGFPAQPSPPVQPATPPPAGSSFEGTSIGVFAGSSDPVHYWRFSAEVTHLKSAGRALYGVTGEVGVGHVSASLGCGTPAFCSAHAQWSGRIAGVIGYQMRRVSPYFTVGTVVTSFSGSGMAGDVSFTKTGWAYSGGVKVPINERWSGDIEIRREEYGSMPAPFAERGSRNELRVGVHYSLTPIVAEK